MTTCLIMTISVIASDIPTSMITWPITVKSVTIMMKISRITEISVMLTELIIDWISSLMVNKDIMCHTTDTQTMDLTIYKTTVKVMMLMLLVRSMVNIQNIIMK